MHEDPMTPATRLDIYVEVRVNGRLDVPDGDYEGFLEHWRRRCDRWQGFVRWSTAPSETRLDWFDQDDIRQLGP